ncbi:MAG: efflux RND transporter permease subunit, partial [Campylobacterales bacterium]
MYKFAINRPITTLMYVLTLVVFGLMSFKHMPAALFPNVDFPIVTVKTVYPGAEPTSVESQITDKIEEAVSGIGGIDNIISTSSEGVSVVTVKFLLERNIDEAANDVRDKVSAVKLPVRAEKPLVSKLDIGAAGSEARAMTGEPVAVVGAGNSAGQAAVHLARHARSVTLLARGRSLASSMSEYLITELDHAPNVRVRLSSEVVGADGDGRLEGIVVRDRASGSTERLPVAGLFVMIGGEPRTEWLADVVARDERGYILTGTDLSAGSLAES